MPGPITHLKAAYVFSDGSYLEPSAFYLGSISPDSVNINGRAEKSVRWPAHLRDKDTEVWLNNVREFWLENKENFKNEDFLKGYLFHIITDIVWDKYFEEELFSLFVTAGIKLKNMKSMRWVELYGYEKLQVELPWFSSCVLPCLSKAIPTVVGTLDVEEVKLWRDRIVLKELEEGSFPIFIDDDFMNRFYKKVSETAETVLK